jgi:hypothetical protein
VRGDAAAADRRRQRTPPTGRRDRAIGEQIADAYRRNPQTDEELAGLEASTRSLIEEEPW